MRRRSNPDVKLERLLGLLAHYVRNTDAPGEVKQAHDVALRMLVQHTPDEVIQVLAAGWQANGAFPGAREKFQVLWNEVVGSRPEYSGRSLEEALEADSDIEDAGRRRHTGTPPPWAGRGRSFRSARRGATSAKADLPPWQADPRGGSRVNEKAGYGDKNFCRREIFERAAEDLAAGSPTLLTTFWTFDGELGRGSLEAFASEGSLGFGGMVAEAWLATGDYKAKAVFASVAGVPGKALLVRLLGGDVANVSEGLWLDYSGVTPWDDPAFARSAATLVALAEEKLGRGSSARPRRVSGTFYCAECQRSIPLTDGVMPDLCPFCDCDLRAFKELPAELGRVEGGFEKAWSTRRNAGQAWLFSYGSNDQEQLAARLGHPVAGGVGAYADGWQRVFRGHSQRWRGGVASLEKKRGARTFGWAAPITTDDLKLLDRYEGVASGNYRREKIKVTTESGATLQAVVYLSNSDEFNAPSQDYLKACAKTVGRFWSGEDGAKVKPSDFAIR